MRLVLSILLAAAGLSAQDRATVTGKVATADGKPVENANVLVYSAGVKKGYSIYCPTCWVDCGKRAVTDAEGNFTIAGLSPDLWFTLLVVREGYTSMYVEKVDPAKGTASAILKVRPAIEDTAQIVRGRVVDIHGKPVRDAVVEQQGVTYKGPEGRIGTRFGGAQDWIDQIAVTNDNGEFELAWSKPAVQFIVQVQPRGMAPKLFTEPTGPDRKTMTVTDGATVRGRLVHNGKPVANAQVGIVTHARASGTTYGEMRIGTREDGTFAITNIPGGRIWMLYPKMESVGERGIGADAVPLETRDDGEEVNIGDIELKPAFALRGRIALSDGKSVPPDMRVTLTADRAWDSQFAPIAADGTFEFRGLPPGVYSVGAGVRGYHAVRFGGEVLVKHDTTVTIPMEPGVPGPPR